MVKSFVPNINACLITESSTIRDALVAISRGGALMACLVTSDHKLIAIVTDSDVRRALLKGLTIDDAAKDCASFNAVTASISATAQELLELAAAEDVREIPLLDSRKRVKDIFVLQTHQERVNLDSDTRDIKPPLVNPMLILAGGKGTRLRSVVSDRPKPLAIVGGKPILQTLIERARTCGIQTFIVSVNYLAEQIASHLEQPQYDSLNIHCLREERFLGTAGCLGLMAERWSEAVLVVNGDVLTNVPFDSVLRHHNVGKADITCVVRPYSLTVPFGVVKIVHDCIAAVHEKPTAHHIVNTGIYVINPSVRDLLKAGEVIDMPALIARAIEAGLKVSPFFMHEYWLDVGKPEDFAKANDEFALNFES